MSNRTSRRRLRDTARHAHAARPAFDGWLRLESSGWYVQVDDVLADDGAATLLAEDLAWHFAVVEWQRRRPSLWRRSSRRAWRAEEEMLAAHAALLVKQSTHLRTLRPISDAAI